MTYFRLIHQYLKSIFYPQFPKSAIHCNMNPHIQSALPTPAIAHFVHSFWYLENEGEDSIHSTVLPNVMVDLVVLKTNTNKWQLMVRSIETKPYEVSIAGKIKIASFVSSASTKTPALRPTLWPTPDTNNWVCK